MCSERAGFSQRHAGLKRQEGLWDDRQRWLPRQQGWTHIPKGCNDRSEVHPCTWRDIRSLCLWCNCSDLDEKFPKWLVATCLLNDQNWTNLTFLGIKSPQHHVVYAFFMYIALYVYREKKKYCTLIQTCCVHLLSMSVWIALTLSPSVCLQVRSLVALQRCSEELMCRLLMIWSIIR